MAHGASDAAARFDSVRAGRRAHTACLRDAAEADLIQTTGVEDPEVADSARLQSIFTRLIGERRLGVLDTSMRRATDWSGFRRIAELRHLSNDRSWMHCLHAAHGPVLEPDEYIDALRIRLGFPFAAKNSECPSCGGVLDRRGIHAQSCAQVETTRGHHRVCHRVHMVASLADPESVPEPVNLIPSRPLLRPADILTSAVSGSLVALDVGVCSPEASGSGSDC